MRVLLVDDEQVILTVSKKALADVAKEVVTTTDPRHALSLDLTAFDLIISDFYMPDMRGDAFLREVRESAPDVPFIFLTQNDDLSVAVELIKQGADDYVNKPIDPGSFVFRVRKTVHEKEQARQIRQILEEQRLLDLENRKLANWRTLYASKDARQTEMLISNLSRNLNQAGGFLWLDLLESSRTEADQDTYNVPKAVLDMATNSARNQEKLFNQVSYIGSLDTVEPEPDILDAQHLHGAIESTVLNNLLPLLKKHDRTLRWSSRPPVAPESCITRLDPAILADILHELTINAIKFSPPASPVCFDLSFHSERGQDVFLLEVRNDARRLQTTDGSGNNLYGIPYDYQELVFDLFFTIEAFPEYLEEEKWTDGAGLYIARKLLSSQGGWITAHAGVDYTGESARPIVRMELKFPVSHAPQEEEGTGDALR